MSKNPESDETPKLGRPEFKPTKVMRRKVATAAGGGMSHDEIAIGLEISRGTLEKHFAFELSHGAYAKRIEAIDAMHRTAKRGNVAAQKAYLAMDPTPAAPPLPKPPEGDEKAKLGKKEQAQVDAGTAATGTDWENILPPSVQLQ